MDETNHTELKGGLGGDAPANPPLAVQPRRLDVDSRTPSRDINLIKQAVRKGWIIRDDAMQLVPDAMLAIALDRKMDDRARVNAARVLLDMNAQNDSTPSKQATQTVNVGVVVNNQRSGEEAVFD